MDWTQGPYTVTDDLARIDLDAVADLLRTSYWADRRPREVIEASFRSPASIPFGVLDAEARTVGFARAVTDRLTISWLCDVMIHPDHRGRGLSKFLVQCVIAHPAIATTRMVLGTRDAHSLYERFGFVRREMMWRRVPGQADALADGPSEG